MTTYNLLEENLMTCAEPQAAYGGNGENENREVGYRRLVVWKNASELRKIIYDTTQRFPSIEMRRVSQMRDAARSIKQNIQEGYSKNSLGEYMRSLQISKGSLAELMGDLDDCLEDKLINSKEYEFLNTLCHRTRYLLDRLLTSLSLIRNKQDWKSRWPKNKLSVLFLLILPYSSMFFLNG